ncbi:hypothetical protein M0E87_08295 [Corynebacterium sp. CCM 9185]|uniref:BioF2-like acetyltransferase domain-containing protein n=1 Tax=Corynebacterium marambiense TaxID=2765364 RepID=A0ABS0VY72_9CORY|nr:hypothetical protein [Corynebacterium marambiense]MBI9000303.1 hypothetical protein [Corynebacterium marambiense]MCK7663658.1 hypothetical protein [Corynebacterium marambiense]
MTIHHSGRPDIPGFDRVAGVHSGADWCRFVDSDDPTVEPAYLSDGDGAFLIAHHCPANPPPHYPGGLVLGGLSGRISRLLLDYGASEFQLPALVDATVDLFPPSRGGWAWPFLSGDDSRRLIRAFGFSASHLRLAGADCTVHVPEGGIEAHIAGSLQSREHRNDVRAELASFARGPVRITATAAAAVDCPAPDRLGHLLGTVERAHGHPVTDARAIDLLERRNRFLADSSTVFTATDTTGAIVGFSVLRQVGDEATIDMVGLCDPSLEAVTGPLYAHLAIWEPLAWCAEPNRGVVTLHLGMQAFEAKTRRGAAMRSLWTVTAPPRKD